jgi:hypothetical protein
MDLPMVTQEGIATDSQATQPPTPDEVAWEALSGEGVEVIILRLKSHLLKDLI